LSKEELKKMKQAEPEDYKNVMKAQGFVIQALFDKQTKGGIG
jgi:hypothetical protein